jgi:hypothetical protein
MRNWLTMVALLTLLGSRATIAQTKGSAASSGSGANQIVSSAHAPDTRLMGDAPVGHRQPHASDVPLESADDLEHLSAEDAAVDRKLNICRGC